MSKTFLFDLDGVIINNEHMWELEKEKLYKDIFGQEVAGKLGSTLGVNMDEIHERAVSVGSAVPKKQFIDGFHKIGAKIYQTAPLTKNLDQLIQVLGTLDFRIGLVSASPEGWIKTVVHRLSLEDKFEVIVSIHERPDLLHKPHPDGYLEAMKLLASKSDQTIALEDSNLGIKSAKAAGIYTIGFRENLINGYQQEGADVYANNISQVIDIVHKFNSKIN